MHGLYDVEKRNARFTSTRFIFGMIVLTSLITFAFCVASIFVRVKLNVVFSLGFSGSVTG